MSSKDGKRGAIRFRSIDFGAYGEAVVHAKRDWGHLSTIRGGRRTGLGRCPLETWLASVSNTDLLNFGAVVVDRTASKIRGKKREEKMGRVQGGMGGGLTPHHKG